MKQARWSALLPILVFLVLYLGMGIVFEYIMGISMGFYNIPIVVVFVIALMVACAQNRSLKLDDKLTIMGRGVGDKIMMTMILIFLLAGIFVGVVGRTSAQSVAFLSIRPLCRKSRPHSTKGFLESAREACFLNEMPLCCSAQNLKAPPVAVLIISRSLVAQLSL